MNDKPEMHAVEDTAANASKGFKFDELFSEHIDSVARLKPELYKSAVSTFLTFINEVNYSDRVVFPDNYSESDYEIIDTFKDFIFPSRITYMGDFREGNLRDVATSGKVTHSPREVLAAQKKILNALNRPYDNVNVIALNMLRNEIVISKELINRLSWDGKVTQYDMRDALPIPVRDAPFLHEWYTVGVKRAIETYLKAKF